MYFVIQHMVKLFSSQEKWSVGGNYSHTSPTAYILCSMLHFSESEIKPTTTVSIFFSALKEKKNKSPGRNL